MQRRSLLKVGLATGLVFAVAGAGVALFKPAWQAGQLSPEGRALFRAVAAAVLDGLLPTDAPGREQALAEHLANMNTTLRGLPPGLQAEVAQLGALLCSAPGRLALAGLTTDWAQASASQVHASLQGMRLSSLAPRQQAFHALRDLTNAAWFANAANWPAIGYPGPRAL